MKTTVNNMDFKDEIIDSVIFSLKNEGINEWQAAKAAASVADGIFKTFGGQTIYIKSNAKENARERNKQILEDYKNGMGVAALSAKYGVTTQFIYWLIKKNRMYRNESNT